MAINNINNSNYFESDDYINFANWVAREIFEIDGNWNNDYFKEIACRKLYKLGIINNNNKTWEYGTEYEENKTTEDCFYCYSLCGYTKKCPHFQTYLDTKEESKENDDLW